MHVTVLVAMMLVRMNLSFEYVRKEYYFHPTNLSFGEKNTIHVYLGKSKMRGGKKNQNIAHVCFISTGSIGKSVLSVCCH
jgi:hypothetical protein